MCVILSKCLSLTFGVQKTLGSNAYNSKLLPVDMPVSSALTKSIFFYISGTVLVNVNS